MQQMTKKILANSLKKLMLKKPLARITIKDIVNDCGFNRQTFYYHFQDIYDLLGWTYKTEVVDSISDFKTYDNWPQGFLKIFQYVKNNKSFCINTFNSLGRDHLENFLYNQIFYMIIDVIEEISINSNISSKEKEFIANFYTYAFIGILTSWIKTNMEENPEDIIKKVEKLINGNIKKAVSRS